MTAIVVITETLDKMGITRIECDIQSCHKIKVILDAFKSMGDVIALRFTRDYIECKHSNSDTNVSIDLRIFASELIKYSFSSDDKDEVIVGIKPSKIASNIPNKKTETLSFVYQDGVLEYGTYVTVQPGSPLNGTEYAQLGQCRIFNHIPAEYNDEPNVKITGTYFCKVMSLINKSHSELYLRPYDRGLQFISIDMAGQPQGRCHVGEINTNDSGLFYPPSYDNHFHSKIPGHRNHDIVHWDHIAITYENITPLLIFVKSISDISLVKIHFHPDRNVPILFRAMIESQAEWKIYISNRSIPKTYTHTPI